MKEVEIAFVQAVEGVRLYRLLVDGTVILRSSPMRIVLQQIRDLSDLEVTLRDTLL